VRHQALSRQHPHALSWPHVLGWNIAVTSALCGKLAKAEPLGVPLRMTGHAQDSAEDGGVQRKLNYNIVPHRGIQNDLTNPTGMPQLVLCSCCVL